MVTYISTLLCSVYIYNSTLCDILNCLPNTDIVGYTFAETNAKANQIANGLQKLGVIREQRAAVLMKNCPDLLFIYYGKLSESG